MDSLNHARAQPVSWVVSPVASQPSANPAPNLEISLILHNPLKKGEELFNNYGPKPNSELLLGYGFVMPSNPDDTIALKLSGGDGKRSEVGRMARGVEEVWSAVLERLRNVGPSGDTPTEDWEEILEVCDVLEAMIQKLLDTLPRTTEEPGLDGTIRMEVRRMCAEYVRGKMC